jgi:hypothetical protein
MFDRVAEVTEGFFQASGLWRVAVQYPGDVGRR